MVDYSKWDALELSDDSDIEVHPNVDKRSFIRAKQSQIHMERQHRKLQVEALKYNRVINEVVLDRLSSLISALQSEQDESSRSNPAEIAFQAIMDSAPLNTDEDTPPPPPEGVFDADSQPLASYTKILAALLDEVNKTLDEKAVGKEERYAAFVEELGVHLRKVQDLQTDLVKKLDDLENQGSKKITSESYHVGFDSSHVTKGKPSETPTTNTAPELLNPGYNSNTSTNTPSSTTNPQTTPSPLAKSFSQIPSSNYSTSHEYITSHPSLILNESDTDALLVQAYDTLLANPTTNNETLAHQYIHQALLLQYCRHLGGQPNAIATFFNRLATPGHAAREVFEKDVGEWLGKIKGMVERDREKGNGVEDDEGVEQIQLHPVDGGSVKIQVPPVGSEDEEGRRAREVFEVFPKEMRDALESGELGEVNRVLGGMGVEEAQGMVGLLREAGCFSMEEEIVDATTEEGKRFLREMDESLREGKTRSSLQDFNPGPSPA